MENDMYNIGDMIKIKYNGKIGAVIAIEQIKNTPRYVVLVDGKKE